MYKTKPFRATPALYILFILFIYLLKHIYPGWPITQGILPWRLDTWA